MNFIHAFYFMKPFCHQYHTNIVLHSLMISWLISGIWWFSQIPIIWINLIWLHKRSPMNHIIGISFITLARDSLQSISETITSIHRSWMIPNWLFNYLHDTPEIPNHVYTEPLYRSLCQHDQSTTFVPQGIFDTLGQRTIDIMITWIIPVDLDVQPSRWFIRINTVNFFSPRSTWHPSLVSSHKWLLGTAIIIIQVIMKDVTTLSGISSVPY